MTVSVLVSEMSIPPVVVAKILTEYVPGGRPMKPFCIVRFLPDSKAKLPRKLLEKAALAAFQNSNDILEESKLLFNNEKWARAYVLALLSAEQFATCFEFRCEMAGFKMQTISQKGWEHGIKPARVALVFIVPLIMNLAARNLMAKLAGQTFVLQIDADNQKSIELLYRIFKTDDPQKKRSLALYVDIKGQEVLMPSEKITKTDAQEIIGIMGNILIEEPKFLKISDNDLEAYLGNSFLPLFNMEQSEIFAVIGKMFLKKKK
jgi:AbiV